MTILCGDPAIIHSDRFWSLVGRYYDPGTDQFLSIDPDVAETGQPYAYTGDDPLNATDPLGLKSKPESKLAKFYAALLKRERASTGVSGSYTRHLGPVGVSLAPVEAVLSISASVTVSGPGADDKHLNIESTGEVQVSEGKASLSFSPEDAVSASLGLGSNASVSVAPGGASATSWKSAKFRSDQIETAITATVQSAPDPGEPIFGPETKPVTVAAAAVAVGGALYATGQALWGFFSNTAPELGP